jgi:hypothetical protein
MVINWSTAFTQLLILAAVALAAGLWKLYKTVHNKKVQSDWPEDEITGRVAIPTYRDDNGPQSLKGCRRKVDGIEKKLNDSSARTSAEINNMRRGLYKKLDNVNSSVNELKLEMQNGMFKVKESARKIAEETLEKHEKRYKHGLNG